MKPKFIDVKIESPKAICPIDKKPCGFVGSCDDVLSLAFGFDMVETVSCPRAVAFFKVGK